SRGRVSSNKPTYSLAIPLRSLSVQVLAHTGHPPQSLRASLPIRGIAATIPERDDQIAHRRKRRGRPIDFGDQQRARYRGRNVVRWGLNTHEQRHVIAMHTDMTVRNYNARICIAPTIRLQTSTFSN